MTLIWSNDQGNVEKYRGLSLDHNGYVMELVSMLRCARQGRKGKTLDEWRQETDNDDHSILVPATEILFSQYKEGIYNPSNPKLENIASKEYLHHTDIRMKVDRDFDGKYRSKDRGLYPGAYVSEKP
ncbi:MAG: hypothetical protein HC898_00205 [Phycisphaerales bacterium]|nr:hypothetical protein [Phycisphaerales bacterium]